MINPWDLTQRQDEILSWIVWFIKRNLYQPSYREIGKEFGIVSTNAVNDHLNSIERKGFIQRRGTASTRSLIITAKTKDAYGLHWRDNAKG